MFVGDRIDDDRSAPSVERVDHALSGVWICVCHLRFHDLVVCIERDADLRSERIQRVRPICSDQHCEQSGGSCVHGDVRLDNGTSRGVDQCGDLPERDVIRDIVDDSEITMGRTAGHPGEVQSRHRERLFQIFLDGADIGRGDSCIADVAEGLCHHADLAGGSRLVGGDEPDIEYVPDGDYAVIRSLLPAQIERVERSGGIAERNLQGIQGHRADDAGRLQSDILVAFRRDTDIVHARVSADVESVRLAVGGGFFQDLQLAAGVSDGREIDDADVHSNRDPVLVPVCGTWAAVCEV